MDLGIDYNAEEHEPLAARDPIPPGKYEAMIIESERKPTSAGDGELLVLQWVITSGEHENRRIFDRVNLRNPNATAVEIGMRQLSSICRAVGKMRIQDSAELHNLPCVISVKIRPAGPDRKGIHRETQNEVTGYFAIGQSATTQAAPTATRKTAATPAAATAAPARKPWERR